MRLRKSFIKVPLQMVIRIYLSSQQKELHNVFYFHILDSSFDFRSNNIFENDLESISSFYADVEDLPKLVVFHRCKIILDVVFEQIPECCISFLRSGHDPSDSKKL